MATKRTTTDPPHIYRRVPGFTHGTHDPIAVVIHCTVSPNVPGVRDVLAIPNYWKRQNRGYNAHVIIDGEGNTVKCALDSKVCWAVAGKNTGRLHIELIGYDSYTHKQWMQQEIGLKTGAKWCAYWCHRHKIPVKVSVNHGIATHAMYSEAFHVSDHTDPGPHFPWDQFMRWVHWYYANGWIL